MIVVFLFFLMKNNPIYTQFNWLQNYNHYKINYYQTGVLVVVLFRNSFKNLKVPQVEMNSIGNTAHTKKEENSPSHLLTSA